MRACVYRRPGSLAFVRKMIEWGGAVRVPSTLNAVSADRRRWRELGVPAEQALPAVALADLFLELGALPSFTCAPYLLPTSPAAGEHVAWGESNAVVYANSVLGARTQKYADLLDLCIAITGRAPESGAHLDAPRAASLVIEVAVPEGIDDSFWPLLEVRSWPQVEGARPTAGGAREDDAHARRPESLRRSLRDHLVRCHLPHRRAHT